MKRYVSNEPLRIVLVHEISDTSANNFFQHFFRSPSSQMVFDILIFS